MSDEGRTGMEQGRAAGASTVSVVVPQQGIFRGQTAIVNLGIGPASSLVVKKKAATAVTFYQEGGFFGGYPVSLMGTISFIRQTWIDADWYRRAWDSFNKSPNQKRPETNNSLAALADAIQALQPVVMEADDDLSFLRVAKIGKEFSLRLLVRGSGQEYRRLDAVKASKYPVIVPLNFPEAPSVEVPEEALTVSLEELHHWDAALRRMQARDTTIALLDVRTPQEYGSSTGHLEGALLIPVQELEGRIGELEPFTGKTIVVYCRTVNRGGQAAAMLRGKGHSALMMEGGISEWNRLQYPVKRTEAE